MNTIPKLKRRNRKAKKKLKMNLWKVLDKRENIV